MKKINYSIHNVFRILAILSLIGIQFGYSQVPVLTLDSVSVGDNNRHIVLGWTLFTQVQDGYIEIHRQNPGTGIFNRISQVSLTENHFTDISVNAGQRGYSYFVVAKYQNGDDIVSSDAHKTIFQSVPVSSVCDRIISISWNNYEVSYSYGAVSPLPIPFDSTKVFVSLNNLPYREVHRRAVTDRQQYNLPVNESGIYTIKIQHFDSQTGITSTSNARTIDVWFPEQPTFLLRKISLDENSENVEILIRRTDSQASDPSYVIQRLNPVSGAYENIQTIDSDHYDILYTDLSAQANSRSEVYKIISLDSCGYLSQETDPAGTIFLQGKPHPDFRNELSWNLYDGWDAGVFSYQILRSIEQADFEIIETVNHLTGNYTDDMQNDEARESMIQYRVMAIENFGLQDTVLSNIIRIEREEQVFIPNAINVSSHIPGNRIFKPVFIHFEPGQYRMVLFNRWGQQVFLTNDPMQGWEGNHNGKEAPAGVYTYVIEFLDRSGRNQNRTGAFILMR
jgi:gliding motility-associated-like protein